MDDGLIGKTGVVLLLDHRIDLLKQSNHPTADAQIKVLMDIKSQIDMIMPLPSWTCGVSDLTAEVLADPAVVIEPLRVARAQRQSEIIG